MYQSVFKDIWGSDLIVAGPHKLFTNGNKTSNVSHVIFGIHSAISECEDEQDTLTDERKYAVIAANKLGFTVHSFPTNPQHILDMGGEMCIPADRDEQDTWTDKREYAVIADNELGLTVHLFPTNPQNILKVGGEICIPADRDSLSILSLSDLLMEEHDLPIEDLLLTITKEGEECYKEISPVKAAYKTV